MENLQQALLESWDRQSQILLNVVDLVTPELVSAKSGPTEWPIGEHLCHVHLVRRFWLTKVAPEMKLPPAGIYTYDEEGFHPSDDLAAIKVALAQSSATVREVVDGLLADPKPVGGYDHPVLFLQHMVWHEGWHVSSIMHALRANGVEPGEEWEEPNIWGLWRVE